MEERDDIYLENDDYITFAFTKRVVDAKNNNDVEKICKKYDFNFSNLKYNTQVHGNKVRLASYEENLCEADALITNEKETPLLIYTADCVPLIFYDKKKRAVALAHAGWQGTFKNIAKETIMKLEKHYNCNAYDIKVVVGPSISVKNYEVSQELIDKFKQLNIKDYYLKKNDKYFLNLWHINKEQLLQCGILDSNIKIMNLCTVEDNDKFFSYRKDKATNKRIGTLIQIN